MDETVLEVFLLLILFQIKHYLVDFVIQINDPNSMRKFAPTGWIGPLAKHARDHAILTFLLTMVFTWSWLLSLLLAVFDFVIHFSMDRIKASPNILGRYKYPNPGYWYSLGADQSVHHLTHYAIIFGIVYWG